MRRALLVSFALGVSVLPARGQTRVYVTGDLFAEVTRLSRTIAPDVLASAADVAPRDGVTSGGGGRIGAFFTPAWSLELGVDLGRTLRDERTIGVPSPIGLLIPPRALQYQSRTSHRFSASSVLLGFHPPAHGRIHAGFRGGVSFMHTERMFTVSSISSILVFGPTVPGIPTVERISLITDQYTTVTNGLSAALAAEAAIEVSRHFSIVPEARAHAGGLGGIVLRPGVAARWLW